MKVSSLSSAGLATLMGLGACNARAGDTRPLPEKKQISSAVKRSAEEMLLVAVTSSGGAAGDITYRVLACKAGSQRCELLANIDTNDQEAPVLSKTGEGVILMVNRGDYVADFRNFSRELASVQPGELYLEYRD